MSYAYDRIENNLTKDLFLHFVKAKYSTSSQVAKDLFTQFTVLDPIARETWFIANRTFYVFSSLAFLTIFDFVKRSHVFPKRLVLVTSAFFITVFSITLFLFKKAAKLGIAKKRRYQEENRHIFERINNLEYIKASSGEEYEKKRLDNLIDKNFQQNKESLR